MGLRAHDHRVVPLCHEHHMMLHAWSGAWRAWNRARLHEWLDALAAEMRERYLRIQAGAGIPF